MTIITGFPSRLQTLLAAVISRAMTARIEQVICQCIQQPDQANSESKQAQWTGITAGLLPRHTPIQHCCISNTSAGKGSPNCPSLSIAYSITAPTQGADARPLVLGPLDGLDVNALLHHLPQRGHLTQLVHVRDLQTDEKVHMVLCATIRRALLNRVEQYHRTARLTNAVKIECWHKKCPFRVYCEAPPKTASICRGGCAAARCVQLQAS